MNTEGFIFEVVNTLQKEGTDFSKTIFVLPSKRAGIFLKKHISEIQNANGFLPIVHSIESFVAEQSGLVKPSNIELLFEFYAAYKTCIDTNAQEPFEKVMHWAPMLIQDFSDIDSYLVNPQEIFGYLKAIKDIEHWSLSDRPTKVIKNYLKFWQQLPLLYQHYTKRLLNRHIGYQGLLYKHAVEHITKTNSTQEQYVFLGFNALNKAEESIINHLLNQGNARIFWDIDEHFMSQTSHPVSHFIRQYKSQWSYFNTAKFDWERNHYKNPKNIQVIGIPKSIGQAKYVGQLLSQQKNLNHTAVVLGDETLINPVITALRSQVGSINITMGQPLESAPLTDLMKHLFKLQLNKNKDGHFYYKDLLNVLTNPFAKILLGKITDLLLQNIQKYNAIYIDYKTLEKWSHHNPNIELIFKDWNNKATSALQSLKAVIIASKNAIQDKQNKPLLLEYLFRFNALFNQLLDLIKRYDVVHNLSTLFTLFKSLLQNETLDFTGEPLSGLQIMGMLESRCLDFETVILTSVNEGVIPAGKSQNSFIPFDVKQTYQLPTYQQKDTIYAYHFYRLIQRAKHIYVLYNSEPDPMNGGEMSRFITQLQVENIHNIKHKIALTKTESVTQKLQTIPKTTSVLQALRTFAEKGFSPSSLTTYIRNPIDFYYQYVLGVRAFDSVEETVASNTLGTVVHNTLEDFYKPLVGDYLSVDALQQMLPNIASQISHQFQQEYKQGNITTGKNLIIVEVAKRFVENFINYEIDLLHKGHEIKIIGIEQDNMFCVLPIPELDFEVKLRGKIDRMDSIDGTIRIIDYKTGGVDSSKVKVIGWDAMNTDYDKYSKPYQILAYAYMLHANKPFTTPIEAGIISLKNLSHGFIKFQKKSSSRGAGHTMIDQAVLEAYFEQLKALILEIFNSDIDFEEKRL
jgi:ATP-dependent helicase/nuclease subunit B